MSSSKACIRKAVFPVAGIGTRFLPATKAAPKEMLTVVNKPLIQYAVEEAYAAGIRQMIFIICHNKNVIEDHFDMTYQFEAELIAQHKEELLSVVKAVTPDDMECIYVRQHKALGLGHAVLCTEHIVGDEPFAILLADDLMVGKVPILKQMRQIYEQFGHNIIAVQDVSAHLTPHYGIIQGESINHQLYAVEHLVEKPHPEVAPTTIAVVGRYILNPAIFKYLRALPHIENEEIQLTDGLVGLLAQEQVYAYRYEGERYDCGSVLGFLKANVDLGTCHPKEGKEFLKWLQECVLKKNDNS